MVRVTRRFADRAAIVQGHQLDPDIGPTSVFLAPLESPLSTFGLDVDTMGMGIVRRQLGWGSSLQWMPSASKRW